MRSLKENLSRPASAFIIVALLALGCYLNSLRSPFLYDDVKDIAVNPVLKEPGRLSEVLTTSFLDKGLDRGLYRPTTGLSYWLDHRLFGPSALGFHLEGVLWHVGASLLVLLLLRRLWPEDSLFALIGASLFALHPVHTEAVSWVSGRSEVLATFWGLAAFLSHKAADDTPSRASLLRVAGMFAWLLAIGAKEMAATVPLLLLLTDALISGPPEWRRPGRLAARYGPYALVAAAYALGRWKVLGSLGPAGVHQYFHGAPLSERGPTMLKVVAAYLARLFLPVNMNATWTVTHAKGLLDGAKPLLALALLAAVIGVAWALRRKAPPVAWGILWSLVALLPVSNILPIGEVAAERFLYWPSVGACAALGWLLAYGIAEAEGLGVRGGASLHGALCFAVLALFAVNTVDRNRDWKSELSLWAKTVGQSPKSVNARTNYGKVLFETGRVEESIEQFEAALALSPNFADGFNNLGAAYARIGSLGEARRAFERATLLQADHGEAWFNLGLLLYKQGDLGGAERALLQAKASEPGNPKSTFLIGVVAYRRGDLKEAEARWRETLSLDPTFTKASQNLEALIKARGGAASP